MREWLARLVDWCRRRRLEAELAEELRFHQAQLERDARAAGTPAHEAAWVARRRLGNRTRIREAARERWSVPWLDHRLQDLRYALRRLRRSPGLVLSVVLTLGLGIGVCAAAFSMINALLLRPLPFPQPERLVHVWGTDIRQSSNALYVSPLDLADMRESVPAFAHVAGFVNGTFDLSGVGGEPELAAGARVTGDLFATLGVRPAIGRAIEESDERTGSAVVVISHGLWERRFGGDSAILGRRILVNAQPYTVVGVMPAAFAFPMPTTELWEPAQLTAEQRTRANAVFEVAGRLRAGSGLREAQAQLATLATSLATRYPESHSHIAFDMVPLRHALLFDYDRVKLVSWILATAVGFVLLLVCANVANLMLARFAARTREVAISKALGARPARLASQFLIESAVLSLAGGATGLIVAEWLARTSSTMVPDNLYRVGSFGLNIPTVLFTLGLVLATALLVGLLPALRVVHSPAADRLAAGTRATDGRRSRRLFDALVVAQLSVGCILLIGALLMLRSARQLQTVDPGFDTRVLSLMLSLPKGTYPDNNALARFVRHARVRLDQLPGVRSAAAVNFLPLNHETMWRTLRIEDRDVGEGQKPTAIVLYASTGYFETMGVPLLRGRGIEETDVGAAVPVVVVNRSFAQRFFPSGAVIGSRVALDNPSGAPRWRTIVGVVSDYHHANLKETVRPQVFIPYAQAPWSYLRLLIRTDGGDGLALVPSVRRALAGIDRNLPVTEARLLGQVLVESLAPERFTSAALIGLGVGALLLAAIGLYGVMAFRVVRSTHEIGVRMALGASRRGVVALMLARAGQLTAIGLAIGLLGAAGLSFGLSRLLFGVGPLDPSTYAGVAIMLSAVALLASCLPAMRASRVNPVEALRNE